MESLHPIAIHFPIVLIVLWPLIDGLGLLTKQKALSHLALGMLAFSVVISIFATATGQAAFDVAVAQKVDPELLNTHTKNADLIPWLLLGVLGVRAWAALKFGPKGHAAGVILGLAMWPLIYQVGSTGGALVYEHGIGVKVDARPSSD